MYRPFVEVTWIGIVTLLLGGSTQGWAARPSSHASHRSQSAIEVLDFEVSKHNGAEVLLGTERLGCQDCASYTAPRPDVVAKPYLNVAHSFVLASEFERAALETEPGTMRVSFVSETPVHWEVKQEGFEGIMRVSCNGEQGENRVQGSLTRGTHELRCTLEAEGLQHGEQSYTVMVRLFNDKLELVKRGEQRTTQMPLALDWSERPRVSSYSSSVTRLDSRGKNTTDGSTSSGWKIRRKSSLVAEIRPGGVRPIALALGEVLPSGNVACHLTARRVRFLHRDEQGEVVAEVTQEVQPFSLLGSPEVVMPIRTRERNLWPIQGNEFVQDPGTLETYIRVYQAFGKAIHFAVEVKRQALAWHILAHRYQLHGQRDGQAIERHWSFRVAPVRDSEGKDLSQVCGSVLEKVAYQATLLSFGSVEDAYEEDIGTPPDLRHVAPPVERSPLGWLEWQTRTIEQLAERTPARLRASVP